MTFQMVYVRQCSNGKIKKNLLYLLLLIFVCHRSSYCHCSLNKLWLLFILLVFNFFHRSSIHNGYILVLLTLIKGIPLISLTVSVCNLWEVMKVVNLRNKFVSSFIKACSHFLQHFHANVNCVPK